MVCMRAMSTPSVRIKLVLYAPKGTGAVASLEKMRSGLPAGEVTELRAVDLSKSKLTRVELGDKPGFAALTHLHLHDNPLAALDLAPLAPGTFLRVLNLPAQLAGAVDLSMLPAPNKKLEINFR